MLEAGQRDLSSSFFGSCGRTGDAFSSLFDRLSCVGGTGRWL